MRNFSAILILFAGVLVMDCRSFNASNKPGEMDGWHFQVCSNETKASRIWFELSGSNGNSVYERQEIKWHSGKRTTIGAPEAMKYMDEMNVSIRTSGGRKARVCILYGQFIIKSVEVSGTESNKVSKENRDNCPC